MGNIQIVHSQSHLLFPKIIIVVLGLLGLGLVVQRILSTRRLKLNFIDSDGFNFFQKNYDKLKFYGTFISLATFVILMRLVGFIVGGFIGMSMLNILYSEKNSNKDRLISIVISIVETLIVWFLFSNVFGVTLP